MKLTQLFLCSAALALPLTLNAATQKSDDRWFEVEIILFNQLGDKSQLKESFPDTSELPKHRRVEDLLNAYLTPNIRGLKQLLPSCDSPVYAESLVRKNAVLPALFSEKSLTELSEIATETADLSESARENNKHFSDSTNNAILPTAENGIADTDITNNAAINSDTINNIDDSNIIALQSEPSDEERAKIQGLVLAAEQEFQGLKFQYTPKAEPKLLCRINESNFADYLVNNPYFDYYGFAIDKVPLLIDAQEEIYNNKTHLLSKDSLQLDDVIKDLRYSKNFRPLLHMGWRQVARPEKESVPVKVYAGENFAADHQKQLNRFNAQQNQQAAQALETTGEQKSIESSSVQNQAEQLQQAKQARIEQIIAQISQVSENTDELLAWLDTEDLSLKLANENPLAATNKVPPIAPIQQWFIEGFFNIHLKHYLFITADFNILDKNLSELATAKLAARIPTDVNVKVNTDANTSKPIQAKAIRFKQNRRVISGEVHYFDHPYFGMVVQIRPYTKPTPKDAENL
jgi:hypothetical protein